MSKVAGYNAALYVTGTSTPMTDEACTEVSGTVFQITATARRILDHDVAIVVKANTVVQSGNYTVDTLFGIVTFTDGSHTGETITVTASYLPRHQVAAVRTVSLSITWATGDGTTTGQNGQDLVLTQKQVSVQFDAIQALDEAIHTTVSLDDIVDAGAAIVLEVQPVGASSNVWRARGVGSAMSVKNNGPAGVVDGSCSFVSAGRGTSLVSVSTI